MKSKVISWCDLLLSLKHLGVYVIISSYPMLLLWCFFGGGLDVPCGWYNTRSIQIHNEFHWIKHNSVHRQTSPNRIPTDPEANISFHFRYAVGTKERFSPKCLGVLFGPESDDFFFLFCL